MTTPHTGVALLQALHGSCDGVTEFRTFKPGDSGPPSGRAFLKSDDVNSLTFFIGSHLREHAYFGVATRRDGSSGTLENCARLPALFVDLDFKHTPEPIARQRLAECPFAPSALVRSGGGLHPYWLLNEPLDLQDQADRVRAASVLRRLAHFLDADLQAAEPARVLRVPGTQNFKYDPPRHVVVELLDPARRYHVSEFDDLLPPEPVEAIRTPFVAPERIGDGARNSTLYKTGRMLKAKGLIRAAIGAALHAENQAKCDPPVLEEELERIIENVWTQPDRAAFTPHGHEEPAAPELLGLDLADFLALEFSPARELVTGVLSHEGGGWIAGEEKLLKTFYCLEEALGLAFGWPVAGKFAVPTRVRVLFIEEEDPPRRTHQRLQALLRGHGLDPGQPAVRAELAGWFRIAVWKGVSLDDPEKVEWVRRTLEAFQPAVVYLDVLRKLTTKDLNKAEHVSPLLAILDGLRRDYGVVIRGAHHNRKVQGTHRAGRGSQELAGSYQLGAWAENSLFFEPIGKREGLAKVTAQCKDLEPTPPFSLRLETEGQAGDPEHPLVHRLLAEELKTTSAAEECKEKVYAALASLPPTDQPVTQGSPGVTVKQLAEALHCSDKTVRKALDLLKDEGRCLEIGKLSKQTKLYGVTPL